MYMQLLSGRSLNNMLNQLPKAKDCSCPNKFPIEKGVKGLNAAGKEITWDKMQCFNINCNKFWIKPN